jgi:pSer/pThr/pTyr-binding forkhead associated (FHA) protein
VSTTQPESLPSGPSALPHVTLHIVRGQARQRVRHVTTPAYLIGSAPDCDLVIGDPQFPHVFAYLIVHSGGVFVRHLGFEPELIVNGRPATRVALRDGDRMQLGPFEFIVGIEWRRTDPDHGRQSFGCLPVGTLNRMLREAPREPDFDSLVGALRLVEDIRQALGIAPLPIVLPAAKKSRPAIAGPGRAAS